MSLGVTGYRSLEQAGAQPQSQPQPGPTRERAAQAPSPGTSATTTWEAGPPFEPGTSSSVPDDRRTGWSLPFGPITLPSPDRIREGGRELWEYHPRDPNLRVTGRHQQPPAGATGDGAESGGEERSEVAKLAMKIGIGGGFVMNGVDILRTVKKYPEALRAAKFDPSLGRLGRLPTALALTAVTRPDARLIDPSAPRLASAASKGMSFTRFDEIAMKSSVLLGTGLAGLQIASAIPNLADALGNEGPWYENLALTTSGRAGVLQLAGGTMGLGMFVTALHQTKGAGATGVIDKVMAAAKAPVMAKPIFTSIGLASGALVMANEVGYLDFLNKGETRSVGRVLQDAVHRTPILNDAEFRTAGLLVGAGVLGFKANKAVQAAGGWLGGGLSGLGKGHYIGGAVVAGLLGAQLLGGLSALDKPAEA